MNHRPERKIQGFLFATAILFGIICFTAFAGAESRLDIGSVVNVKMRSLAAGSDLDLWTESDDIKAIRMAESLPDDFVPSDTNIVSAADSERPVYIFFDNENDAGIMYFCSNGEKIVMNPDSSVLFACNTALTDVSGVADWDSSHVFSLDGTFMDASSLADVSALSKWDVHNVTGLIQAFMYDSSLSDISALANWDTSNVTQMQGMFAYAKSLPDALALRNWDTSSVTDMRYMFSNAVSLAAIDVSNWDTGKVTSMANMFQVGENYAGNGQLREILGLGNLDVSNVTDMTCMFYGAGNMTFYDIAGWDVSRVISMNHMFCDNFSLRSLDLSAWDVSNVRTMYCMFDDNYKLKTIGDVSRWNTASLVDAGGWLNGASSFVGDNVGTLDLSGWDTIHLKAAGEMFRATKLRTIDLSGWTFDSITNERWENAGKGIYYETGNGSDAYRGLGGMFKDTAELKTVYVSQSGLDSYYAAMEKEVNTLDMWSGSKTAGFTVQ